MSAVYYERLKKDMDMLRFLPEGICFVEVSVLSLKRLTEELLIGAAEVV